MARSTVEVRATISTVMTHFTTIGPFYLHFQSVGQRKCICILPLPIHGSILVICLLPLSGIAVAPLSSTEILVIGGWSIDGRVKSVYKGTQQLNQ